MTDLIHIDPRPQSIEGGSSAEEAGPQRPPVGIPSNEVYARVGDAVLQAAQNGVRRGVPPQDIIREILEVHGVRLSVGELRLLLTSRRLPPERLPSPHSLHARGARAPGRMTEDQQARTTNRKNASTDGPINEGGHRGSQEQE